MVEYVTLVRFTTLWLSWQCRSVPSQAIVSFSHIQQRPNVTEPSYDTVASSAAPSHPGPEWTLLSDCGPFSDHAGTMYFSRERLPPNVVARYGFRVETFHCNKRETCHGGMLATFADIAMARGICFVDGVAPPLPTVSMSLDFMGPAPLGAWVEAHTSLGRLARGTAFVQAMMYVGGEPILRASAVFKRKARSD